MDLVFISARDNYRLLRLDREALLDDGGCLLDVFPLPASTIFCYRALGLGWIAVPASNSSHIKKISTSKFTKFRACILATPFIFEVFHYSLAIDPKKLLF
jgi:hypothetical protein